MSVPVLCWVSPMAQSVDVFGPRAYISAAARIRAAVGEVVGRQVEAGVDVVSDGELSKPSYATYVKDRLTGFGGASHPLQYRDLVDFPELARRVFGDPGRSRRRTPACTGPIAVRDAQAAVTDADNLRAALAGQVPPSLLNPDALETRR